MVNNKRLTFHIQHYLGLYSHCKFNLKIQKRNVSNYFQNGWQVTQKKVKDQRGLNNLLHDEEVCDCEKSLTKNHITNVDHVS